MSNQLYPLWKQTMLSDKLSAANVKVMLVNTVTGTVYTYSAAHQYHSDVTAGAIVATSGNLASKTFTNGVFDAADLAPAFSSLSGVESEALILFEDTGVSGTSELILYIDTATGLALTPDGNNVNITWNASGIFAI